MRVERKMFRLLLMLTLAECYGLSISHWDLEGANKTCDWKANCAKTKNSRMSDEVDWKDRNCMCDKQCAQYGDCCPDSIHFDLSDQRRGSALYQCMDLRQFGGIYMQPSCPPKWTDMQVRAACELASSDSKDPLVGIPVTSNTTGVTYKNLFCAYCHNDHYDIHVWHPRLECPTQLLGINNFKSDIISKTLDYDETENQWGLLVNHKFYPCSVDPVIPETAIHIVRRCLPNIIKTCAVNWTNIEVRNRCEAYTSLVYDTETIYRNPHCAMCNNVPLQYLQCSRSLMRTNFNKDFSPVAFSVLFDLTGKQVGMKRPCGDDQLYDPFFKRCRSIVTELLSLKSHYMAPEPTEYPGTVEYITFDNVTECNKFVLEKNEFTIQNATVYVPQYRKRFNEGDYELREDGKLEICVGTLGVKLVDKFGIYMGYVTFAGLGISIIFLILHLTAFSLISELRNLSGKNLASLCVSLLIAYTTFMAGQVLEGLPCFIVAIITFYAFLASFTWMLTMAFDVWRTLRLATAELRVSAGKQWRKFFIYSIWSWLSPAVIVAGTLWFELTDAPIGDEWRPKFAVYSCWFGQTKALLIFFALPLTLIMALNIAFFGSSTHMIYSTTSTTKFTASAGTQRDFRLYIRLAVVMGLTWTTGLIAGLLDIDVLWYAFIVLNTLQGLFIFLAFTCNDKVIRALALRRAEDKPLRPPSFSWSTDSTRRSHMGSDQATTDTLY